jgi:tRNA G18 (ribose-2'-O)-methylase SpoU
LTKKKYALVLGNEVEGISDEILTDLDVCLEIPQLGTNILLMFQFVEEL